MGSSFGGTVKLTGETEYKKALNDIANNLRVLNSEMKTVTSQFERSDKSVSNLTQQNEVLNKKITEQREKVTVLAKALAEAKEETGENSVTTQKWQTELNNAQAELNKLERELKNNTEAIKKEKDALNNTEDGLKDYGDATDDAGDKSTRLSDIIKGQLASEIIIAGVKALANAMMQVGKALVNVGKQALESYGEYEQLVGGIEAMFGGLEVGADKIAKVTATGANAWKDLTLSYNDYYSTFNSTYPLIKSSIEDENEAIDVTNRMLTLESDLANTFGYDMSQASTAINWALKGTYSYIDNLNIGIKGTKEGFLEASRNCGYMVDSVDELTSSQILDVLEQYADKFGVLGKTADEAKTTIQGSTKMLQASWSNMLIGISDDTADFEQLVSNLVESIGYYGDNILPRVEIIVNGIVDLILSLSDRLIENLPAIMEAGTNILQSIINGILETIPNLTSVAGQVITELANFLMENLPTMLQTGITVLLELIQGIAQTLPELIPVAVKCVLDLVTTVLNNVDMVIETGIQVLEALIIGIINALPELIAQAPYIIARLTTKIIELLPEIISAGIRVIGALASGLIRAVPDLVSRIPYIISSMVTALKQGFSDMVNVGRNLVEGIWNGLSGSLDWIKNMITGWVGSVKSFIKRLFGIKSPSTVFRDEIGQNLALGIGVGFSDTMDKVSEDMANAIPTEFDTSVNANIGGTASGGFSYDSMVSAFKTALADMKVELDDREVGRFVTRTVEREVFA